MTVLNFILADEAIYLVTDTIVSDPSDMGPMTFTTKVHPVPHWQGLICGTGIMQFIVEWYCTAVTSILARDMKHLDEFAPNALRELFLKHREYEGRDLTSTIYHLGFDEAAGRFIGFAYRSTDNFVSEALGQGIRLKPDPEDTSWQIQQFPKDFIEIAESQKLKDEVKPLAKRVGVGGHLISYMMQRIDAGNGKYEVATNISRCHEFADFSEAYLRACANLPANNRPLI